MLPVMVLAATMAMAQTGAPPVSTSGPTVVVTGHKSTAPSGKVKVDTTVYVDDEDVSELYGPIWPAKAYDLGVNGRVTLACRINARGFAQSCEIATESPLNMGFGAAALQIQPGLRVKPPADLAPGQTVTMNIAIKFDAPKDSMDGGVFGGDGTTALTGGRGIDRRTGRPVIMQSVTMMEHPIWNAAPSFEDMRRVYPTRARGTEGFVVMRCKVDHAGALWGCDASKEQPEKQGFDRAALSLAPLFHVAPQAMAKAPSRGEIQVMVPIRFAPTELEADPVVLSPFWISGVDTQAVPKLFPPEAVAHGLTTGRGVARCIVGPDGMLTGCSPEKADPDGVGFSEAAVVLAATMKMNLWSVDAGPVRGGVFRLPVRLNLAPPQ